MQGVSTDMLVSLSMNYNNSGASHKELVANLRRNNLIRTNDVLHAFQSVTGRFFSEQRTLPLSLPISTCVHSLRR